MIIATTENVAGHRVVETKGTVFGVVVRSRSIGGNVMANLRSLGGGEIFSTRNCLKRPGGRRLAAWSIKPSPWAPTPSS